MAEEKNKNYFHSTTDEVPDWVKKLDDLKNKIKANLSEPNKEKPLGIKFCHPINVPDKKD